MSKTFVAQSVIERITQYEFPYIQLRVWSCLINALPQNFYTPGAIAAAGV